MAKDLLNQDYSLKGFENWLNAVEGRDKGLRNWANFKECFLEKWLTGKPRLTKQSKRFWEVMMRAAKYSGAEEHSEIFLEWLEKQKVEDGLTREDLERLIEIKEKELQKLKEQLKRIS